MGLTCSFDPVPHGRCRSISNDADDHRRRVWMSYDISLGALKIIDESSGIRWSIVRTLTTRQW